MSSITLPKPIEDFVNATNAHDLDGVVATFADQASVGDDGHTHTSPDAIRAWVDHDIITPKVVLTPQSYENGRLVAGSEADLPGGPWVFAFDFVTTDDRISDLKISLA
ncbi:hypothetical protein M2152_002601 [Microbacteriaceae bacterium SG_E_30_P1]|uniref:SnoaL-like domain-containing protein n=1 Tax=Antiquaquibacter oligotrophicus TaxID=2880260 RepID=A0ABT6KRD9_9MICO|nr:nuclear transport factor 2 family protein [Antiquaquibacter oligotrophicus]MDH6182419.1 hypothetical protein [Antiquaquibacter oligotrophicus]UDF14610.1 nuclear transport factor 2 family protein [Antiquaquibacter oligotrophicus]